MADLARAAAFVEVNGDALERARLHGLLHGEPPSPEALAGIAGAQRDDGGFAPSWAPNASSVHATCFRVAELDDLPREAVRELRDRGLAFLAGRQREDGSWQEDDPVAEAAPPWARPGDEAACLYLTANCGFTLGGDRAQRAAAVLVAAVAEDGSMPTYLQAHWLAVPVLRRGWHELEAARICRYIATRLDGLGAGSLAWLANVVGPADPVGAEARVRLAPLQGDDGSWASEDGPGPDVQTTLAAVRALSD